jgi:hypothetical protein
VYPNNVIIAATILPMLSSIDPDSNALLALRQHDKDGDSKSDSNNSLIDKTKDGGAVELFKKDDELEEYSEDDDDENLGEEDDEVEDDKLKINIQNPQAIELDLGELYDETESNKDSELYKVSKSVLNQVSAKYSQMFKRLLSSSSSEEKKAREETQKIIYLRDFGGMEDAFTRIMLKSLVMAIEDLKQKGHRLMIVASHCTNNKADGYYIPAIANMRRVSVLPLLQDEKQLNEWNSIMKSDEEKRISEINAKQLLAMYGQKNPLDIKTEGDLLNELLSLNNISKSIWIPSDVDRRVTTAIGHALEHNKTKVDLQDFRVANDIVEKVSDLEENTWKKLKDTKKALKLKSDDSIDVEALKRNCNEYERKLLPRMVDPCKH